MRADASTLPAAEGVVVTDAGEGAARIDAQGKAAHASLPHLGKSAIDLLVAYLLENDVCTADEKAFFELGSQAHERDRRIEPRNQDG